MKKIFAIALLALLTLAYTGETQANPRNFVVGGGRQTVIVNNNRPFFGGSRVFVNGGRQTVVVNNRPAFFGGRRTIVVANRGGFGNRTVVRVR